MHKSYQWAADTSHPSAPQRPATTPYLRHTDYSPCRLLKKIECVSLITKWSISTRVSPGLVDGAPAPVANAARARRPNETREGENILVCRLAMEKGSCLIDDDWNWRWRGCFCSFCDISRSRLLLTFRAVVPTLRSFFCLGISSVWKNAKFSF